MVEGEKTLNMIETLSKAHKLFDRHIRIISCDVLINYTRPVIKTRFETVIRSIIHKSVLKTLYNSLYGKPGQIPFITDLQYMKSITRTILNNVWRKMTHFPSFQDTIKQENNSENLKRSDFISNTNIQTNWYATKEKFTRSNSRLGTNVDLNDGLGNTESPIFSADKTMLLKSKNADTRKISSEAYGINLPTNHKDYWKNKQLYESINK